MAYERAQFAHTDSLVSSVASGTHGQMIHGGWPTGVTVRPRLRMVNGEMARQSLVAGASGTPKDATLFTVPRAPFPVPPVALVVCVYASTCPPPATAQIITTATATDGQRGGRTDGQTENRTSTASQPASQPERTKTARKSPRGGQREQKRGRGGEIRERETEGEGEGGSEGGNKRGARP